MVTQKVLAPGYHEPHRFRLNGLMLLILSSRHQP